jgi:hypothetical protein
VTFAAISRVFIVIVVVSVISLSTQSGNFWIHLRMHFLPTGTQTRPNQFYVRRSVLNFML